MKRRWIISVTLFAILAAAIATMYRARQPRSLAPGVLLRHQSVGGSHFTFVQVDLRKASVNLYWKSSDGQPFQTFERLSRELEQSQGHLLFATNAGIFNPGYTPAGLHVESGTELTPLNLDAGTGNFYLNPNGVFFIDSHGPHIVASTQYPGTTPDIRLATQSGPLLLVNGQIHPAFRPDSTNLQIRSGVGILPDNQIAFVLSTDPVTFHQFATFFHDRLRCQQALYLDGAISRMFPDKTPSQGVSSSFAGILAITQKGHGSSRK